MHNYKAIMVPFYVVINNKLDEMKLENIQSKLQSSFILSQVVHLSFLHYTTVPSGTSCLIDTAAVSNLPQGISVNHCLVHPRGKMVLVILMNQNNHNIWIWQPLLAAEIHVVEHLPWDYGVEFQHQGNNIEVAFQPIPPGDIMATVKLAHDEPCTKPSAESCPTFGPCPNTSAADFDFHQEVECLPFKLN